MNNRVLGNLGEEAAKIFLIKNGYRVVETNYKNNFGEIDIVAIEKDCISFIEVKTRSSVKYGLPCEAVNYKKIEKIKKVALGYLNENRFKRYNIRFDVVEVYLDKDRNTVKQINLIKDAF
ncbi:MAG: YraN family protein [Caloramator sp.]|nr:YraN family protein [Caloramator sp.]